MSTTYPSKIIRKKISNYFFFVLFHFILADYPFNVDSEGWPEPVHAPSYPFEYYHDNGRNPPPPPHHQPNLNDTIPLAIRRHSPGTTVPSLQQLPSRSP